MSTRTEKPLISIIIACYNAETYIDSCFESLMQQTYQNYEIVVCDDASTDRSFEILQYWAEKDSRIIVLKNERNLFAAATRNRCFAASHGDYFMIQDIDDTSKPNRIERLLECLEREKKEISFVSSSMDVFRVDPEKPYKLMRYKEYPTKWSFLWNSPFSNPASMFTRKCIEDAKGYRVAKETRRGQDYDMFMRLYSLGYKGKNIQETLYNYRLDSAGDRRRTFQVRIGEYKIRKRGFYALGLMPLGALFLLKPFAAYPVQKIRYIVSRLRDRHS